MSSYSVYLVECRDGSFYTGIATDVERRFREHGDSQKGAKYLRGKGPLKLVFQQEVGDRSLATRIESRIKKLPRSEKSNLGKLPLLIEAFVSEMQPGVSEG